jgi:hypothetical protein
MRWRPDWWLTRAEIDDVVWALIPPFTGATAVEISKRTGIPLWLVRRSLARQLREGRVGRLRINKIAHQWMPVAMTQWPENRGVDR